jgi:hypothetical protein
MAGDDANNLPIFDVRLAEPAEIEHEQTPSPKT